MKTLKEMVSIINEAVKVLEGNKMEYFEMHDEIKNIIKELDIDKDMVYYLWNIQIDNEEMPSEYKNNIISLELDGVDDKRNTYNKKVKINSLTFKIDNPELENMTINEVVKYYKKMALENYINNAEQKIQKLYKELEETRLNKENMIRELISL
jgi:hypothetical protein